MAPMPAPRRAALIVLVLVFLAARAAALAGEPLRLGPGPQLFIDDYLIGEQSFLSRTVNQPPRLPEPLITGSKDDGDRNFQPYVTVLRDPGTGRFRAWYNHLVSFSESYLGHMESADGIHWERPHRALTVGTKMDFGASVIDRGRNFTPADQRYAQAFWREGGMRISVSPDGLQWRPLSPDYVLKHNHDITMIFRDEARGRYLAVVSVFVDGLRIPHESTSPDLMHWEQPWPIIRPKAGAPNEQGETQFYSMSGLVARGDLLIGMVKVLRDDLNATPGKDRVGMGDPYPERKAAGIGYTVLAWSRDGRTWQRDHEPFIDRDRDPARWDHAIAWADCQLDVGDETYIYYGGYKRGHKVERQDERQIGLVRMPRDRYVAREADLNRGRLVTKPLMLAAKGLTVNAKVVGELRVRLIDEAGQPVAGCDWAEVKGDGIALPVAWSGQLAALGARPVRLEFELCNAQLFGFELE